MCFLVRPMALCFTSCLRCILGFMVGGSPLIFVKEVCYLHFVILFQGFRSTRFVKASALPQPASGTPGHMAQILRDLHPASSSHSRQATRSATCPGCGLQPGPRGRWGRLPLPISFRAEGPGSLQSLVRAGKSSAARVWERPQIHQSANFEAQCSALNAVSGLQESSDGAC